MADLHPIVIPPLEHTYKSIKYTCSSKGLCKDEYLYDPHAEKLIPPKTTKAGAEPKELEKKPVAYWKAQCAFRGLNQSGSINDLQVCIFSDLYLDVAPVVAHSKAFPSEFFRSCGTVKLPDQAMPTPASSRFACEKRRRRYSPNSRAPKRN